MNNLQPYLRACSIGRNAEDLRGLQKTALAVSSYDLMYLYFTVDFAHEFPHHPTNVLRVETFSGV